VRRAASVNHPAGAGFNGAEALTLRSISLLLILTKVGPRFMIRPWSS